MFMNSSSARLQYATVAMLELALRFDSGELTCVRDIAQEHRIPLPFLTQILNQLRTQGLVTSVRGPSGGYRLQRAPDQISIAQIGAVWQCDSDSIEPTDEASEIAKISAGVWQKSQSVSREYLENVYLNQLVQRLCQSAHMYHI